MRRILLRVTAVGFLSWAIITTTLQPVALSQDLPKPTRLRFPRGSRTATARSLVGGEATDYYVVRGRAGQTMIVRALSRRKRTQVGVAFMEDSSYVAGKQKESDLTRWEGRLTRTGDYLIQVNVSPYSEWYTLSVTLR
jgi:hypothetical protein